MSYYHFGMKVAAKLKDLADAQPGSQEARDLPIGIRIYKGLIIMTLNQNAPKTSPNPLFFINIKVKSILFVVLG